MTHHILATLGKQADAFARTLRNQRGAASIEFGLLAALIAVAAIQAMSSLGDSLSETFTTADAAMAQDSGEDSPVSPLPFS